MLECTVNHLRTESALRIGNGCNLLSFLVIGLLMACGGDDPLTCPDGEHEENGVCVQDVCPAGTVLVGDICLSQDGDFESSEVPVDGDMNTSDGDAEQEMDSGYDHETYNPFVAFQTQSYVLGGGSGEADEMPEHTVILSAFELHKFEVTVEEFTHCIQAGACTAGHYVTRNLNDACNYGDASRTSMPMNCVDFLGAREYCLFIGADLPLEAQWEAVARGTERRKYPWGDEPAPDCSRVQMQDDESIAGCGSERTVPPETYALGATPEPPVYAMAGNVAEWVFDWYSQNYDWCVDCADPLGDPASDQTQRIVHGGSYISRAAELRNGDRTPITAWDTPMPSDGPYPWIGFRCARMATSN